jgi:hypothetical protein
VLGFALLKVRRRRKARMVDVASRISGRPQDSAAA